MFYTSTPPKTGMVMEKIAEAYSLAEKTRQLLVLDTARLAEYTLDQLKKSSLIIVHEDLLDVIALAPCVILHGEGRSTFLKTLFIHVKDRGTPVLYYSLRGSDKIEKKCIFAEEVDEVRALLVDMLRLDAVEKLEHAVYGLDLEKLARARRLEDLDVDYLCLLVDDADEVVEKLADESTLAKFLAGLRILAARCKPLIRIVLAITDYTWDVFSAAVWNKSSALVHYVAAASIPYVRPVDFIEKWCRVVLGVHNREEVSMLARELGAKTRMYMPPRARSTILTVTYLAEALPIAHVLGKVVEDENAYKFFWDVLNSKYEYAGKVIEDQIFVAAERGELRQVFAEILGVDPDEISIRISSRRIGYYCFVVNEKFAVWVRAREQGYGSVATLTTLGLKNTPLPVLVIKPAALRLGYRLEVRHVVVPLRDIEMLALLARWSGRVPATGNSIVDSAVTSALRRLYYRSVLPKLKSAVAKLIGS